jgi:hypothetical protein
MDGLLQRMVRNTCWKITYSKKEMENFSGKFLWFILGIADYVLTAYTAVTWMIASVPVVYSTIWAASLLIQTKGVTQMSLTKSGFLMEYERGIVCAYDWARDGAKLARFMDSVRRTITTSAKTWNHDSDVATAIWRAHGFKGKPTLKGLRALPD